MFLEIVIFLLTLLFGIWLFFKRKYTYWERMGMVSVPAEFPYGSLKQCLRMKQTLAEKFQEIYSQHPDKKMVGFYGPYQPMLCIKDPELIKIVLVKEFNSFLNSGFTINKKIDPLMGYNPFSEVGMERWKASRSIHSPMLTLSKIKTMSESIFKSAENLIKYISSELGKPLEMKNITRFYTIDAIVSAAYGIESDSFFGTNKTFDEYTKGQLFGDSAESNYAALNGMFIPALNWIFRCRFFTKEVEAFFTRMYKSCSEHRKKNNIVRLDYIHHLMTLNDKAVQEKGKAFSDPELAAHNVAIFGDGVETTSLVLTNVLYYIAVNSRVQEKLRTEISNSITELDFDKIQSLEYLQMVITETLRLRPAVAISSRTCTLPIELDGYKIQPGVKVFIPTLALQMDPKYYPEPEKFLPERFSNENRVEMNKFTYLPFGEGPRMCVGYRLGITEVKIAVVALLLKFKMTTSYKMEIDRGNIFVMMAKGNVDIMFTEL